MLSEEMEPTGKDSTIQKAPKELLQILLHSAIH